MDKVVSKIKLHTYICRDSYIKTDQMIDYGKKHERQAKGPT